MESKNPPRGRVIRKSLEASIVSGYMLQRGKDGRQEAAKVAVLRCHQDNGCAQCFRGVFDGFAVAGADQRVRVGHAKSFHVETARRRADRRLVGSEGAQPARGGCGALQALGQLRRRQEGLSETGIKPLAGHGGYHEFVQMAEIDAFALEFQKVDKVVCFQFEVGDLCLEGGELVDRAQDLLFGESDCAGGRIGLSHD